MKKEHVLMLVLFFTASLGLPQSSGGDGSSSTANSGSTSNINFVNKGSPQLITAFPGAGTPVFPGLAGENKKCFPYKSAVDPEYSMVVLRARAKHARFDKHHVDWSVGFEKPDAISENDDPIAIVEYNPDFLINPGDKVLGSGVVPGKYLGDERGLIAVALLEGKKKTHMRRAAMVFCYEDANVTKASGWGAGAGAAKAGGNNSEGLSLGYSRGTSTTTQQERLVLHIYAMNDNGGIVKPPVVEKSQEPPKAEPQPPPTIQPQPVQTIRIEVVGAQPAPSAPAPAAPTPTTDQCILDPYTFQFPYDRPKPLEMRGYQMSEEDHEHAKKYAQWLKEHPTCTVHVEGHASPEGTHDYNWLLASRRATTVYNLLLSNCDENTRKRVFIDSGGKEHQKSDYYPENRRVIILAIASASGK